MEVFGRKSFPAHLKVHCPAEMLCFYVYGQELALSTLYYLESGRNHH